MVWERVETTLSPSTQTLIPEVFDPPPSPPVHVFPDHPSPLPSSPRRLIRCVRLTSVSRPVDLATRHISSRNHPHSSNDKAFSLTESSITETWTPHLRPRMHSSTRERPKKKRLLSLFFYSLPPSPRAAGKRQAAESASQPAAAKSFLNTSKPHERRPVV